MLQSWIWVVCYVTVKFGETHYTPATTVYNYIMYKKKWDIQR